MIASVHFNGDRRTVTTVHRYRWDWNRKLHRELCEFEHRVADEKHGGAKAIRLFNQVQASRELATLIKQTQRKGGNAL